MQFKQCRRDFIKSAGVGLGSVALSSNMQGAANNPKPNIIYILADDLGYGDLGCYGQKLIKTPHIDKLAEEGIKFTDHYSGAPLCAPARCTLITGLHTGHTHIRGNFPLKFEGNIPIPKDSNTIGKQMKKAGYATAAIGKWGLGYPGSEGDPINQGFDLFFGYNCQRQAHSYYPEHLWRNKEKVILKGNIGKEQKDYSHDLLTEEALKFIKENSQRPFFLYLPYTIPHTKFQVPELGEYENTDWDKNHKIQAAMITRMDRDVGRIGALVKELGLDKNTLIIFTSDNGPHGGGKTLEKFNAAGPLQAKKGSVYEGGIRVPFVARWPEKIKPGTVSNHVSAFWDMLPTFSELAGVDVPDNVDGISFVPVLLGTGQQRKHEYLYWELGKKRGVRMGNWKGVKPGLEKDLQLYDLEKDIAETKDLALEYPEIVAKIEHILKTAHVESELFPMFKKRTVKIEGQKEPKQKKQKGSKKKQGKKKKG